MEENSLPKFTSSLLFVPFIVVIVLGIYFNLFLSYNKFRQRENKMT